jgi:hypothetical protein
MVNSKLPQKLRDELWYRGDLSWKWHSGQKKIDDAIENSKGQLFVANCARQFGKSTYFVCRALSKALRKKRARVKYGTAYLSDLTEFVLPCFELILEDCPPAIKPIYKTQGSKWVFPSTKSEIKLVGLDKKPNGLRGNVIDEIILDEAGFIERLGFLYRSIIIPATTHRPDCRVIMPSTPPTTPAHDFGEFVQRAEAEGCYIKCDIYENPLVDQTTIARLMKESGGERSTTWRREYLCELVTDADSQIIPEWKDEYVQAIEPDEFYRFYHLYEGMDLGVKDFTLDLFGYYDFRRASLVVQDELKLNGPTLTTQSLHDAIRAKEASLWPETARIGEREPIRKVYRRIADNNNPILIQDLSSMHKMVFIATDKDNLEAMINEVRLMVSRGQIIVHPRCTQLIGCLKYGVWDSKKKAFARSQTYGHYDALAALVYLVRNLDKNVNPIPATYGFDPRNSRIKINQHESSGRKLLEDIFKKPTRKIGEQS